VQTSRAKALPPRPDEALLGVGELGELRRIEVTDRTCSGKLLITWSRILEYVPREPRFQEGIPRARLISATSAAACSASYAATSTPCRADRYVGGEFDLMVS
jgi:hypothetical protein